jgi:hypothetical protein
VKIKTSPRTESAQSASCAADISRSRALQESALLCSVQLEEMTPTLARGDLIRDKPFQIGNDLGGIPAGCLLIDAGDALFLSRFRLMVRTAGALVQGCLFVLGVRTGENLDADCAAATGAVAETDLLSQENARFATFGRGMLSHPIQIRLGWRQGLGREFAEGSRRGLLPKGANPTNLFGDQRIRRMMVRVRAEIQTVSFFGIVKVVTRRTRR